MKEELFVRHYEDYSDAIFRHCYFRVSDRERAKELMQECFMKTWEYVCKGQQIENMKAFLYKVANNLICNEARKKTTKSLEILSEFGGEPGVVSKEISFAHLDGKEAVDILKKINELYRDPIVLKFIDGFTIKEIAQILDLTQNVVSVRIHRGLKQLRKIFEANTIEDQNHGKKSNAIFYKPHNKTAFRGRK
ncbi:MAG: RNA polymerase sigma factor [bacterium]